MSKETQEIKCPIRGEQFGLLLSKELTEFITKYTDTDDRKEVSRSTGIGYQTVRYLAAGSNSLTIDNQKAVIALINKSIENCQKVGREAENDELDLMDYLKTA